ncbi:MAG: hypothetical protein AAGD38_20870, partial [Acidobacteriota bacterium]
MTDWVSPALLLVVVPLWWLGHHAGLFRSRIARMVAAVVTLSVIVVVWPHAADGELVRRVTLLVALLALALVMWRPGDASGRAVRRTVLLLLTVVAVANHVYWGDFHGRKTWVHWHELTHYYLGAKYFDELGYGRLYDAMLRAEAEAFEDRFRTLEARDLRSNEVVDIRVLLRRSDETKTRFSPERWVAFVRDVTALREHLSADGLWKRVYLDHGFNATPIWAWLGGMVASSVPAGDLDAMTWLTLLDPVLLGLMFVVWGRVFGLDTALFSVVLFTVIFGAGFSWIGGAFLRFAWLVACGLGVAALASRRWGLAGVC